MRDLVVRAEDTPDNRERTSLVLLEQSPDGKDRPICLVLTVRDLSAKFRQTRMYRASLNGELEYARVIGGQADAEGRVVGGALIDKEMSIQSSSVQAAFRKELDFWVKGLSWKKPKKKSPNSIVPGDITPAR
jgi:hypothetical protein